MFAASIIDQLQQERCPVVYFFFRQIIDANHSPMAALRDWLAQLLPFSPPLQATLKDYVDDRRDIESLSSSDLWRHLRQATTYIPKVYCVVDALDEMDQTKDLEPFLQSLAAFADWRPSRVKVVATSRPVPYIEKPLRTARAGRIRLEEREVDADIAAYVRYKLERSAIPPEVQEQVKKAVPGRANGLFLYAKLAMDSLLRPGADVERVLGHLPLDLNVMYTELLREHSRRSGVPDQLQLLILQAVTHASRPLRLLEIAEFIDVTQRPTGYRDLKAAKDLVRSACGPLLEILPDETVSVVHHSLTEFLNGSTRQLTTFSSYPVLEPGPAHNTIALVCLSYLLSGSLNDVQTSSERAYSHFFEPKRSVYLAFPFVKYAANNWFVHARKATTLGHDSDDVNREIDRLLSGQNLIKWSALIGLHARPQAIGRMTPLEVAVRYGLSGYVEALLAKEDDIGHRVTSKDAALCLAAKEGHDDIVDLLIRAGANPNTRDERRQTPMLLAASNNHPGVVKTLIQAGVSPFDTVLLDTRASDDSLGSPPRRTDTPVLAACRFGHTEVMREFLDHVKTKDQWIAALHGSVSGGGRAEILKILLDRPVGDVDIDTPMAGGLTALAVACSWRNPAVIRLLLRAGANPNTVTSTKYRKDTPLLTLVHWSALPSYPQRATSAGEKAVAEYGPERKVECLELLIEAGADLNSLDNRGDSALHLAEADPAVCRRLLDAGADPNIANGNGETLLYRTTQPDIVRLLLSDPSIDLETKVKGSECTPLLNALRSSKPQIAALLIEAGADVAAVDVDGLGVFHCVARSWDKTPDVVKQLPGLLRALAAHGANPNALDYRGDTALHALISNDGLFHIILDHFIEAGADVEARDRDGQTPLFRLLKEGGSAPKRDRLIQAGARIETVDNQGRNLLHLADSNEAMMKLALLGLDPKHTDHAGNTLWHARVMTKAPFEFDFVRPPPQFGVDPLQPNHEGRTPLHVAAMFGSMHRGGWTSLGDLVQEYRNQGAGVDQTDRMGVTALHLVSTHSELDTRRLLEAGADPLKATYEGLTPLHLAARSRKPSIIAILLEWLESRCPNGAVQRAHAIIPGSNFWLTPLHFACTSGVVESVRLLLQAGAAVDNRRERRISLAQQVWVACAEFEKEDRNWHTDGHREPYPIRFSQVGSVSRHGTARVNDAGYGWCTYPRERLDEILDLLAEYCPPTEVEISHAIRRAAEEAADYTVECLSRKRQALFPDGPNQPDGVAVRLCLARREANRKAIHHAEISKDIQVDWCRERYSWLIQLRDYDAACEELARDGCLQANEGGFILVHELVAGGFASLLQRLVSRGLMAKLDDRGARDRLRKTSGNRAAIGCALRQPLLPVACNTSMPNMEVVRTLVEELGANVNAKTLSIPSASRMRRVEVEDGTALHTLAQGEHWWQAAQALPYLLGKGADIESRDAAGLTPLLAALGRIHLPSSYFHRRAVEVLVAHGADVNAVEPNGGSCLARAVENLEMVRLLLRHGAVVTHCALAAAIQCKKLDTLEVLLAAHGTDPNRRWTPEEREEARLLAEDAPGALVDVFASAVNARDDELRIEDMYPLDIAVHGSSHHSGDPAIDKKMIRLLLDHGADPNARYENTSIMHRIIGSGKMVDEFLDLPSLDLESRDSTGRTLLHVTCNRPHNTAERKPRTKVANGSAEDGESLSPTRTADLLLDRGADVRARSANGCTTLHHLMPALPSGRVDLGLLRRVAAAAPEMMNVPHSGGRTPLHAAFDSGQIGAALVLLKLGADPHLADLQGNTSLHLLLRCKWDVDSAGQVYTGEAAPAEALAYLVSTARVDVNARNAKGETPLFAFFGRGAMSSHVPHRFSEEEEEDDYHPGDAAVWKLFESVGMDFKALNKQGESLLHTIAHKVSASGVEEFKFLLEKGLDPLAEDDRQRTPLDIAAGVGAKGILGLFQRDGKAKE